MLINTVLWTFLASYAASRECFHNPNNNDLQLHSTGLQKAYGSCLPYCSQNETYFDYAYSLENQICFCSNSSLSGLVETIPCQFTTCNISDPDTFCILKTYERLNVNDGIVDWKINTNPSDYLLINENIELDLQLIKGGANGLDWNLTSFCNGFENAKKIGLKYIGQCLEPGQAFLQATVFNDLSVAYHNVLVPVHANATGIGFSHNQVSAVGFKYSVYFYILEGTNLEVLLSANINEVDTVSTYVGDSMSTVYGPENFDDSSSQPLSVAGGFIYGQFLEKGILKQLKIVAETPGELELAIVEVKCSKSRYCPHSKQCKKSCDDVITLGDDFSASVVDVKAALLNVDLLVKKHFMFSISTTGTQDIVIDKDLAKIGCNNLLLFRGNVGLTVSGSVAVHSLPGNTNLKPDQVIGLGALDLVVTPAKIALWVTITRPFEVHMQFRTTVVQRMKFSAEVKGMPPGSSSVVKNSTMIIQELIKNLTFVPGKPYDSAVGGYSVGDWVSAVVAVDKGTVTSYIFQIVGQDPVCKDEPRYDFKVMKVGNFTMRVTAANYIRSEHVSINFTVLEKIKGQKIYGEDHVFVNEKYNLVVMIINGSDVQLQLCFGDDTPAQNNFIADSTNKNGKNYTFTHTYTKCGIFEITAKIRNHLTKNSHWEQYHQDMFLNNLTVSVSCRMSDPLLDPTPPLSNNMKSMVSISEVFSLTVTQDHGSYVTYKIYWGDGTNDTIDQSEKIVPEPFSIDHVYTTEGNYVVFVNASNKLEYMKSDDLQVSVLDCTIPAFDFEYGTELNFLALQKSKAHKFVLKYKMKTGCEDTESNLIFSGWTLETISGESKTAPTAPNPLDKTSDTITFVLPAKHLEVGRYKLIGKLDFPSASTNFMAWFEIVTNPLTVKLLGGDYRTVPYKVKPSNKSLHYNFTMSASQSFDPDDEAAKLKGMSFDFQCRLLSDMKKARAVLNAYSKVNRTVFMSNSCMSEDFVVITSVGPVISLNTEMLLEGITYEFVVNVEKDIRKSNATQTLYVSPGDPPPLTVLCVANCGNKLNIKERVIRTVECDSGCDVSKDLSMKWIVEDENGNPPVELTSVANATTTGFHGRSFVINTDTLEKDKFYTFIFNASYIGSIFYFTWKEATKSCSLPVPGSCEVSPTEGLALKTQFRLYCKEWTDTDKLLTYEYFYVPPAARSASNLSSTTTVDYPALNADSTSEPLLSSFYLGSGIEEDDYYIDLVIRVGNLYKAYTTYDTLKVKVKPTQLNSDDMLSERFQPSSLSMNSPQEVSNIAQAIILQVNIESDVATQPVENEVDKNTGVVLDSQKNAMKKADELKTLQETRTKIVDVLFEVPVTTVTDMKGMSDTLAALTVNEEELLPHTQQKAAKLVDKLANLLPKEKGELGADKLEVVTQGLLVTFSNLLKANSHSSKLSMTEEDDKPLDYDSPTVSQITTTTRQVTKTISAEEQQIISKDTVTNLLSAISKVKESLQQYKVPGENATIIETESFDIMMQKELGKDLDNKTFQTKDYGNFLLPSMKDVINSTMQNGPVSVEMTFFGDDPFTWDAQTSKFSGSTCQTMELKDKSNGNIPVKNLQDPIEMAIKNKAALLEGRNVSLSFPSVKSLQTVKLDRDPCSLLFRVRALNDEKNRTTLNVYIQFGKPATDVDFDVKVTVTKSTMHKELNNISSTITVNGTSLNATVPRKIVMRTVDSETYLFYNFSQWTHGYMANQKLFLLFSYDGPPPERHVEKNLYTFDEKESIGSFVYELKSFCADCLFWNESKQKWLSDGCQLKISETDFEYTRCLCNHLTAFGGFYVAPNPLPVPSLALLKEGYALLVVVCSILLLYVLGLIITRRIDLRDETKIGVCPLLDNRPDDKYLYEITVNTGSRRSAGTGSNIFFTVAGELGDSGARRLKDTERVTFQRSSSDVFIMTTPACLGELNYIRLWHDNKAGGWYLRSVELIDLQTEEKFLFIANRWISIDREDCSLDCVIPISSREELSDFNYLFATKTRRDMSDNHIWFSIYARPPRSPFTRCQRLSVATSLLMCAMTASTMFYGQVPKGDPATENKIAGFTFTWQQVFVAIISACITVPINVILVGMFRSIRPQYKPPPEAAVSAASLESTPEDHLIKPSSPSYEMLIKGSPVVKKRVTPYDSSQPKSSSKKVRQPFYLPPWCLYIVWFLCVGTILSCGYIVVLYGMSFGNKKSLDWLASVTLALLQDVLLLQPMKVFLVALFVAVIVKNLEDEEKSVVEMQGKALAYNEKWLHKLKNEATIFDRVDIDIQPPSNNIVSSMKVLRLKQQKMYAISRELLLYVIFACLVTFIGYITREHMAYHQTRDVTELFNLKLRKAKPRNRANYTVFKKLLSSQDFWPWMDKFFLKELYPEPWYNLGDRLKGTNKEDFPGKLFLNDLNSKIVNGVRLRQVRVKPHSCLKPESIAKFLTLDCLSEYGLHQEESRDFHYNWSQPHKYKAPINTRNMPWRYQDWLALDAYPLPAELYTYFGGGYTIELFPRWKNELILSQAKERQWIDRQTRAVIIEFALFNAATNHFNMVTIVFEFPPSGGLVHYYSVGTFKLYTSTSGYEIAMLGSQALFILWMVIFAIREGRLMYKVGLVYFREFWNLVEFANIILAILAVIFYFYRAQLAKKLLKRLPGKQPNKFINFQFASYWDLMYTYIVSLIVFFVTIKFIKLLRFNRRMSMLSSTLKAAWYPLSMFGIIFFIILSAVVMSSSLIFGTVLQGYRDYFKTIASIISLLLGKFSYHQFENTNRVLGPVFFFAFNIMVNWIIMNMFISILNDVFAEVQANIQLQNNDYEMVEFFMTHLKGWLGINSSQDDKGLERSLSLRSSMRSRLSTRERKCVDDGDDVTDVTQDPHSDWLDKRFKKHEHLLKEQEDERGMKETLDKFVNCMNLLYFDDVTVAQKMNDVVKKEMGKKI